MAAKKPIDDGLTVVAEAKEEKYYGPMVTVFLPKIEEEGNGVRVDQYERVTIANENGEKTYMVLRGERVQVPASVFVILKQKYPDL